MGQDAAYTGFAFVYDLFMDNIPYDSWCDYLQRLLNRQGIFSGLVAELGCGTGMVTRRLREKGYDMIGIDSSEEMLAMAREKEEIDDSSRDSILYLQQDMRKIELYGTVAAFVSVCDSMNYLLKEEDLLAVFRLVNNYLDPGGVFIFDLKTEFYFENLAEATIAENRPQASFIWENFYDRETKINQYDLTVYASEMLLEENTEGKMDLEEPDPPVFLRFDETHYQRAYSLEIIKELLAQAGMEFVAVYDAFTEQVPQPESERIYVIAREGYQEQKRYQMEDFSRFSGETGCKAAKSD